MDNDIFLLTGSNRFTSWEQVMKHTKKVLAKEMQLAMDVADIPRESRGAFVRWANRWGLFDVSHKVWVEYSPLELHHRSINSVFEMWEMYLSRPKPKSKYHK